MANKHMKGKFKGNGNQITMRYYYVPIRIAKTQTLTTSKAGENMEQQEHSFIAGGDAKWYSHFGRQFSSLLQN